MSHTVANCLDMKNNTHPDPDDLQLSADNMPEKVSIPRYWSSITTLRDKGYSWREISEWLSEKGLKVHHSQLHRYAKRVEAGLEDTEEDM